MRLRTLLPFVLAAALGVAAFPTDARAHCDTMDGPVVTAGQKALETGELAHALIWIDASREGELREVFAAAREVRRGDAKARALADRYFLETLVRLHRAGEGEPYTGLRPAGAGASPALAAADRAVATGALEPAADLLVASVRRGLEEKFEPVRRTRSFAPTDVAAGRAFVRAYVPFVHHVEGLQAAAAGGAAHGEAGKDAHGAEAHAEPRAPVHAR